MTRKINLIDIKPSYDALDKYIQGKKRAEFSEKMNQPATEESNLMKAKRHIPQPGWNEDPDKRERPLLPRRGNLKIETYI